MGHPKLLKPSNCKALDHHFSTTTSWTTATNPSSEADQQQYSISGASLAPISLVSAPVYASSFEYTQNKTRKGNIKITVANKINLPLPHAPKWSTCTVWSSRSHHKLNCKRRKLKLSLSLHTKTKLQRQWHWNILAWWKNSTNYIILTFYDHSRHAHHISSD